MPNSPENGNLPITALFNTLLHDLALLLRKEIELARSEMAVKAGRMTDGALMLGLAAVFGLAALLFLLATVALALAEVMPAWAAALVVGLAVGAVALVMFLSGRRRIRPGEFYPERTVRTLRDDAAVARRGFHG